MWPLNDPPELKRVSKKDRDEILKLAWRRSGNNLKVVSSFIAITAALLVATIYLEPHLPELIPFGRPIFQEWVFLSAVTLCGALLFRLFGDGPVRRAIRQIMNERGYPTCVQCGYDLSAPQLARCPNCGKSLHSDIDAPPSAPTSSDDLVPVYQPYDFLEGDAIRQALTDAGIFCHLEGENHAGRLYNTTRIKMRVLVRATDAQRAREIIDLGRWPRYT